LTPTDLAKPAKRSKRGTFGKNNRAGGTTSSGQQRRHKIDKAFRSAVSLEDFKKIAGEIKEMAMMQPAMPGDAATKLKAATYIIDRFMGKARQQVEVDVTHHRADPVEIRNHFVALFGLDQVAPQAKQVQSRDVDYLEGEVSAPGGAGLLEPPAALPEAVDRGPGDVQDRGEGAAARVHLDRGPVVGPPPPLDQD
jgi:hypothetical protein